jgi:hypothetical protein
VELGSSVPLLVVADDQIAFHKIHLLPMIVHERFLRPRCRSLDVMSTYRIVTSGSAWPSNFSNAARLRWTGRAGVGLPALMKLLGHVNPEMTMRYVDVAGADLQREFHLARSQPRHLAPQPKAPNFSPRGGLNGVVDSLLFARPAVEVFRRSLPDSPFEYRLDQLANRLTKILAETRKLNSGLRIPAAARSSH